MNRMNDDRNVCQKSSSSVAYSNNYFIKEAGRIVSHYFSAINLRGIIQLQESYYYRHDFQLNEFISALTELFL